MKYLALFLIALGFSSCAVVSKQYYYVPSGAHQSVKDHNSYFKMVYSRVKVSDKAADSVGSITASNGIGQPLLMGPLIFPVIPVGGLFMKTTTRFEMDIDVRCNNGYFMQMAIDSNRHKKISDSLNNLKAGKAVLLNTRDCYMMVNDTLKVPLNTEEYFLGNKAGHSYRMKADIRFRKINTLRLVTGNDILDSTLKNISFKRKTRITFNLLGES